MLMTVILAAYACKARS